MNKRKLIVLTDISTDCAQRGEPDDTQSLVRLLHYGDQFDILGLIATHTPHLGRAAPEYIHHVIDGYEYAEHNLGKAGDFPSASQLRACVKHGADQAGIDQINTPSEGALHLLQCVEHASEPVWIIAWGGVTDLAQALLLAQQTKSPDETDALVAKMRIYAIGDQYDTCGAWIRKQFADLFYIITFDAYRGVYRGGNIALCSPEWTQRHILDSGPFGAYYPLYQGGDIFGRLLGGVAGMKEGDTPSFLFLLDNGLNVPEHPEYGGWGGRFVRHGIAQYQDSCDQCGDEMGPWVSVSRWRADFQADFKARLALGAGIIDRLDDPDIAVDGDVSIPAGKSGEFALRHGDNADVSSFVYPEAGTFRGNVLLDTSVPKKCKVYIPSAHYTGTLHLITRAHSHGVYGIARYVRTILNIT